MQSSLGILYIVATPIGNLGDITLRAIDTLKHVNWIVAEDTRHCKVLLKHYGIETKTLALHEHNEKQSVQKLIEFLLQGDSIALISDAGTPLISDPGYRLVTAARQVELPVVPLPGACAAITALSASGLPTDSFCFEGFLPATSSARRKRLESLAREPRTLIFYESPHRVLEALADLEQIFGPKRQAVLARELTKLFETIHSSDLASLLTWVKADPNQQRGEMVLLVAGAPAGAQAEGGIAVEKVLNLLLRELPLNQAVKLTSEITGEKKNKLYRRAVAIKGEG